VSKKRRDQKCADDGRIQLKGQSDHPSSSLGQTANIEVVSFHWDDTATTENINSNEYHDDIPNARRSDGTAWYLDNGIGDLVHFHLAKILPRIRRRH